MLYIADDDFGAEQRRCIAHPAKKRQMLKENTAIEYTAKAFADAGADPEIFVINTLTGEGIARSVEGFAEKSHLGDGFGKSFAVTVGKISIAKVERLQDQIGGGGGAEEREGVLYRRDQILAGAGYVQIGASRKDGKGLMGGITAEDPVAIIRFFPAYSFDSCSASSRTFACICSSERSTS